MKLNLLEYWFDKQLKDVNWKQMLIDNSLFGESFITVQMPPTQKLEHIKVEIN